MIEGRKEAPDVQCGVVGGGWDKSSLWMDLFSLDSIFVIVTCNCLPFSYWRCFFSETYLVTSAENNVLDPPNLKIFLVGTARRPYMNIYIKMIFFKGL